MPSLKICCCCGDPYLENKMSVYKLTVKGKLYRFCSYSCYRKIQTLREDKQYEEIDKILNDVKLKSLGVR